MIILDENIPESQLRLLRSWHFACRQIGLDESHKGIRDDGIVTMLHRIKQPTFFTRDYGFYRRELCHDGYCVIVMDVRKGEFAVFARRLLRHPHFRTKAKRAGAVIRLSHSGIRVLRRKHSGEIHVAW